jgi:hypothetical protein
MKHRAKEKRKGKKKRERKSNQKKRRTFVLVQLDNLQTKVTGVTVFSAPEKKKIIFNKRTKNNSTDKKTHFFQTQSLSSYTHIRHTNTYTYKNP